MNKEQEKLKDLIDKQKLIFQQAQYDLDSLMRQCIHQLVREGMGTICEVCSTRFGWWCLESPDHVCHYHSYHDRGKRLIELVDGMDYEIPENSKSEPEYENDNRWFCFFCGEPEERK